MNLYISLNKAKYKQLNFKVISITYTLYFCKKFIIFFSTDIVWCFIIKFKNKLILQIVAIFMWPWNGNFLLPNLVTEYIWMIKNKKLKLSENFTKVVQITQNTNFCSNPGTEGHIRDSILVTGIYFDLFWGSFVLVHV